MKNQPTTLLLSTLIVLTVLISGEVSAQNKKVLIIESYHSSLVWTAQCESGIRSVLGEKYDLYYFYMDTKRIPMQTFHEKADLAWEKYLDRKPDLVLIGDDNALRLLGPRFSKTQTPVVFFGINNNPRFYFDHLPQNITGVLERTPVKPLL